MHEAAWTRVLDQVTKHGPFGTVIEVGSRDVNGTVRRHFRGSLYLGIDIVVGPGVDLVANGATYKPMQTVDCVVCCEVIEHSPQAKEIIENAWRMLNKGGWLILTCAGPGRTEHSTEGMGRRAGEYYCNVTPEMAYEWLGEAWIDVEVVNATAVKDLYISARKPW